MGLNRYISALTAVLMLALLALSCAKERVLTDVPLPGEDDICSQRVLFSSGNVENVVSKAPASPYMVLDGRFVCTMYYKSGASATEQSPFDIDGGTSILTWLSVNNNYGNSVYRLSNFADIPESERSKPAYVDYGFDPRAEFFYWKNRMTHVFVAYADYHRLTDNDWQWKSGWTEAADTNSVKNEYARKLFMYPKYSGAKVTYIDEWQNNAFYVLVNNNLEERPLSTVIIDAGLLRGSDWYESHKQDMDESLRSELERTGYTTQYLKADGSYYRRDIWHIGHYESSEDVVVFCMEQKKIKTPVNSKANVFDLTRSSTMTAMTDQPDPIVAVTKKKPEGSSQETNRVHLYFKHQFSQVQVNLKNGTDGSTPDISFSDILKVELLGVSQRGYVFTYITPAGDPIPADYEPVDLRSFDSSEIAQNRYGTSFQMFAMPEGQTPSYAVKSFNAIAFGILEAIRITWREGADGVVHSATMLVDKDEHKQDLKHLQSGKRYVYDIELQRSTVALLHTHLVDWILDTNHEVSGNGTISTGTSSE